MLKNTIINNPINLHVKISKIAEGSWGVAPTLVAFPAPGKPRPKNIIFLLDNSGSMKNSNRLEKVKIAVSNLLDKLNSYDTFSIVSFNHEAQTLVASRKVSMENIREAKSKIQKIHAGSNTNFKAAFMEAKTLISSREHTAIIFLTDGEDSYNCTIRTLTRLFSNQTMPLVIPIGIWLNTQNNFLNQLATVGRSKALYINDNSQTAYQNVFDEAFKQATEQSHAPARLEMTLQAKSEVNSTTLDITRRLDHVYYDGTSSTGTTLYLNSPTSPRYLKLRFHCDSTFVETEYKLNATEITQLTHGGVLDLKMKAFKWKNNTLLSWMLAISALAIGVGILTSVGVFAWSTLPFSTWLWPTIAQCMSASLIGLAFIINGMLAIARKTFLLPTKFSADAEQENAQQPSLRNQGFFTQARPRAKLLVGTVCGGALGYMGGVATLAANVVIASGISPALFLSGCTAAGAIAMLLLIYGCSQLYTTCSASSRTSMSLNRA